MTLMSDPSCSAWLLSVAGDVRVAIGELEMLHIILGRQRFYTIPRSPVYCRNVFLWQGQVIPVFDLDIFLHDVRELPEPGDDPERYICVINYCDPASRVHHGALLLRDLPVRISVSDEQMCDLPDNAGKLREISSSCFNEPSTGPVPVLNLSRVFGPCEELP